MKQTIHAIVDKKGKIAYNSVTVTPPIESMGCTAAWAKFFKEHTLKYEIWDAEAYESIGYRCVQFRLVEVPFNGV